MCHHTRRGSWQISVAPIFGGDVNGFFSRLLIGERIERGQIRDGNYVVVLQRGPPICLFFCQPEQKIVKMRLRDSGSDLW